ncbi:MAG: hypothetical protein JO322_06840 [Candidatus Eremiobacteraeota bacterium]|nr:hypothetical protein [Candidatus Eremiobacteraeota bacterium]
MPISQPLAPSNARLRDRARAFAIEAGDRILSEPPLDPSRGLNGFAGFALLFAALAEVTGADRFTAAMHAKLRDAALMEDRPSIGLFGGISGLRAVAALAIRSEARYSKLVAQCDAYVDRQLTEQPRKAESFDRYDLISGWSGALLARGIDAPVEPGRLAELIVWVLEDPDRWRCPHPLRPDDPPVNDLGLAHGVSGMLAALTLTLNRLEGEPARAAAQTLRELCEWRIDRGNRVVWPPVISTHLEQSYRSAWCYGAAGVLAVIHNAAVALHDGETAAFAADAMQALAAQTPDSWELEGEAICHGLIGNALCFASIASATGSAALWSAAFRVAERVMDRVSLKHYDAVGLLDGISGIALALLTLTGHTGAAWMRLFGLRPIS